MDDKSKAPIPPQLPDIGTVSPPPHIPSEVTAITHLSTEPQKSRWLYFPLLNFLTSIVLYWAWRLYTGFSATSTYTTPYVVSWGIGVLLTGLGLYSVLQQFQYLQSRHPNIVKMERIIGVAMVLAPTLALVAGDLAGASAFHTGSSLGLLSIAAVILSLLGFAVTIIGISNSLLILTGVHRIVKIFGLIGYIITWLIVAASCWIAYAIMYSLHDPSTE